MDPSVGDFQKWRQIIVPVLLVGGLCGISLYAYKTYRTHQAREEIALRFHDVLLALVNYESQHGYLPPRCGVEDESLTGVLSGSESNSWRFRILDYLGYAQGLSNFEPWAPWSHPGNMTAAKLRPGEFCFSKGSDYTSIMAIAGPGTAFEEGKLCSLKDRDRDIDYIDGTTILLIEVRNSGVPWFECGDLDIRSMPRSINDKAGRGISGNSPGAFAVGFADGQVWFLRDDIPLEVLSKFFTIAGAKESDRDRLLGPYCGAKFPPSWKRST